MANIHSHYKKHFSINDERAIGFKGIIWDPEEDTIPEEKLVAIDTETEFIVPGLPIKPVILQAAYPESKEVHIVMWYHFDKYLKKLEEVNSDIKITMHNVGFDMHVLNWRDNKFLTDKLSKGHVIDTGVRFFLKELREGYAPREYPGLALVCKGLNLGDVKKDAKVRCGFRQDLAMTREQIEYAAFDAVVTLLALLRMPNSESTEHIQTLTSVSAQETQITGFLVDRNKHDSLKEQLLKEMDEHRKVLEIYGYFEGVSGNGAVLNEVLEGMEKRYNVKFVRTPKSGMISTKEEHIQDLDIPSPFLNALKEFCHIRKLISTYLNEDLIGADGRTHAYFNILVRSGRTSCRSPNEQNPPKKGGVRETRIARPGHVLVSIDYDQIELCALAENNYTKHGMSRQGDLINEGKCIHCDMASGWFGIDYEDMYARYKEGDEEASDMRAKGKIPNFGYPGGLGGPTMKTFARSWGVNLTLEECLESRSKWLEQYPEMVEHLKPEKDEYWTQLMIRRYCDENNITLAEGYTEENMREYLYEKECREMYLDKNSDIDLDVEDGIDLTEDEKRKASRAAFMTLKDMVRYKAITISGRVRSNCTFTAASNTVFQGLAADGAKLAWWYLTLAGYRVVDFIHDEFIIELPYNSDTQLNKDIERCEELMLKGMSYFIKRVNLGVGTEVMYRWKKKVDTVYNEEGLLIPADAEEEKEFRSRLPMLMEKWKENKLEEAEQINNNNQNELF